MSQTTTTEIVKASQLQEHVIDRIFEMRKPDAMPTYRKELAQYKRRLGKRKEQDLIKRNAFGEKAAGRGFQVEHLGQTVTVQRPEPPRPLAWAYSACGRG